MQNKYVQVIGAWWKLNVELSQEVNVMESMARSFGVKLALIRQEDAIGVFGAAGGVLALSVRTARSINEERLGTELANA